MIEINNNATKIAINLLTISSQPSGSKTYLLNLVRELTQVAGDKYEFHILCNREIIHLFRERIKFTNCQLVEFPIRPSQRILRVLIEQLVLPIWLWKKKIDLLFAARNIMPLLTPCATVSAVLSMHLNYQENEMPWYQKVYGNKFLEATAKRTSAIISISEYAGKTYAAQYRMSPDKVFVSQLGYNMPDQLIIKKENPKEEFILFVSTLFPHKNVSFLLEVFSFVVRKRTSTRLVIVGRDPESLMPTYSQLADKLSVSDRVDFTGAVSEEELNDLYAKARVFVFPSLVEGFGLSVLEAMAHGIPVVASNRTSIPEVVGEAGLLLDPVNPELWAEKIIQILEDKTYHKELGHRGEQRAKLFTWQRTAENTLDCFSKVLEWEKT